MHFWIDKRSQTCGFSGRHRVPASLSAASCGRQRRRSRGKPMVTPVHRFQPIECVAGGGGGLGGQHGARRSLNHHQQLQQQHHHHHRQLGCFPPAYSGITSPAGGGVRSTGAHAVELDSSVFLDLPIDGSGNHNAAHNSHQLEPQLMTGGRRKCVVWASFALAALFVAGAKFYIDHQRVDLELPILGTLLVVFLFAGCTLTLCRLKAKCNFITAAVTSSSQTPHSTTSPQGQAQGHEMETASNEDIVLGQIVDQTSAIILSPPSGPTQAPEQPPPPYHIAILLPQQTGRSETTQGHDESPPPSYDKAIS
ncbi:hypothetical protein L798_12014 [Zootermopsis nevadensis]|uniref:Uncharacterized protein n=1 Tax=Zootermopsis nevadensis TaxID=136037 RepID=A0A067R6G4_ZOONE|nr:hypothetical protein L798_12014 [Zootermopsis nevadensis]